VLSGGGTVQAPPPHCASGRERLQEIGRLVGDLTVPPNKIVMSILPHGRGRIARRLRDAGLTAERRGAAPPSPNLRGSCRPHISSDRCRAPASCGPSPPPSCGPPTASSRAWPSPRRAVQRRSRGGRAVRGRRGAGQLTTGWSRAKGTPCFTESGARPDPSGPSANA